MIYTNNVIIALKDYIAIIQMPSTHNKSTSNPITHRGLKDFIEISKVREGNMWKLTFAKELYLGEPQFHYLYRFITNEDSDSDYSLPSEEDDSIVLDEE
jgi:hypothetical protein